MAQTDSEFTSRFSVASRWPHIIGVLGGIGLLTGVILLWTGQFSSQPTSTRAAFGSTANPSESGRITPETQPILLSTGRTNNSKTTSTDEFLSADDTPDSTATNSEPNNSAAEAVVSTGLPNKTGSPPAQQMQAAEFKQAILGTWKQYSFGHRVLNVEADGTATIDVKLDGFAAFAFGEKLHFDITWTIEGDELIFKTVGGTPEAGANAVTAIYGDRRIYHIREINAEHMLLKEKDEEKTPWDRVTDDDQPVDDPPDDAQSAE